MRACSRRSSRTSAGIPVRAEIIVGSSAGSVTGRDASAGGRGVRPGGSGRGATGVPCQVAAFFAAVDGADEALPSPSLTDIVRGWHLPSPALADPHDPPPVGGPAERHRQHAAARGALRPPRAHRGARPARVRLAARPLDLRRPAGRRPAGRVRSRRVAVRSPVRSRRRLVRDPQLLRAGPDRIPALHRRRRPLRHQRRRPRARRPRRRDRRVAHVGRPRHEPRGRRRPALGDAPPPRARDPAAAGARHRGRAVRAQRGHPGGHGPQRHGRGPFGRGGRRGASGCRRPCRVDAHRRAGCSPSSRPGRAPPDRRGRVPWTDAPPSSTRPGARTTSAAASRGTSGRAEAFGQRRPAGIAVDLGSGPGWYTAALGRPVVALDGALAMVRRTREVAPHALGVQADLHALPFRRGALAAAWARNTYVHLHAADVPLALGDLHRSLAAGAPVELTLFRGDRRGPRHLPGRRLPRSLVLDVDGRAAARRHRRRRVHARRPRGAHRERASRASASA